MSWFGLTKAPRFIESPAEIPNPDRGFYVSYDLVRGADPSRIRLAGRTLAMALVELAPYRDLPALPGALLEQLDRGFAAVRTAGIKVIVRFRYAADAGEADAKRSTMLAHIAGLAPVLRRNADVIACMQAGFIGAWGEWHSSTNGLDNPGDRNDILRALLEAFPGFVQVRTPAFKQAFDGDLSRIGHHNDCFLSSATDMGTYVHDGDERYVDLDDTVPVGGETCALDPPRTSCANALARLAALQWSFCNLEYSQPVLAVWEAQGCFAEITKRLGYRLALVSARVSAGEPGIIGKPAAVALRLVNRGFAAPFNPRRAYLVFRRTAIEPWPASSRVEVPLATDVARWKPGPIAVAETFTVGLSPGTYRVSLWLPDAAPSLRADPRYAIRLANEGTWDETTGENFLTDLKVKGVA